MRVDYQEKRGRARQRARTRRQILEAAVRLMHEGTIPTVEQAAAAADVSPATGYRYFRTQGALLRDAVEAAFPTELVHQLEGDALARVDQVIDRGFPELVKHEVFDRAVLRLALDQWLRRRAGKTCVSRRWNDQVASRSSARSSNPCAAEPRRESCAGSNSRSRWSWGSRATSPSLTSTASSRERRRRSGAGPARRSSAPPRPKLTDWRMHCRTAT